MKRFEIRDACRANFIKYTRRAFDTLPRMESPFILDLGCGTGVLSLEMARWTEGMIHAVDSDIECIRWLEHKVAETNLEKRIRISHASVLSIDLNGTLFDIILAEGILNIIGFDTGLKIFTKHIKPGGHFMIHDDALEMARKLEIVDSLGLSVVDTFLMDESVWWDEYIACLQQKIPDYEKGNRDIPDSGDIFKKEKSEIAMYLKDPKIFNSRYYVLKKS